MIKSAAMRRITRTMTSGMMVGWLVGVDAATRAGWVDGSQGTLEWRYDDSVASDG